MLKKTYYKDKSINESKFEVCITNGLFLHSIIPLNNGKESHCIIEDPSINTDFTDYIDFYLQEHFKAEGIKYPYSEEFIKACYCSI